MAKIRHVSGLSGHVAAHKHQPAGGTRTAGWVMTMVWSCLRIGHSHPIVKGLQHDVLSIKRGSDRVIHAKLDILVGVWLFAYACYKLCICAGLVI